MARPRSTCVYSVTVADPASSLSGETEDRFQAATSDFRAAVAAPALRFHLQIQDGPAAQPPHRNCSLTSPDSHRPARRSAACRATSAASEAHAFIGKSRHIDLRVCTRIAAHHWSRGRASARRFDNHSTQQLAQNLSCRATQQLGRSCGPTASRSCSSRHSRQRIVILEISLNVMNGVLESGVACGPRPAAISGREPPRAGP